MRSCFCNTLINRWINQYSQFLLAICTYIYGSCRVTNQNTFEKKNEGYRGSKSSRLKNIGAKEQRVYGSWHSNILLCLRCILTDFKINCSVKYLSTLIIQRRFYGYVNSKVNYLKHEIIEPWFITGFTDAVIKNILWVLCYYCS